MANIARRWTRSLLAGDSRAEAAEQVACVLVTSTVLYGGREGFNLRLVVEPEQLRLVVSDHGQWSSSPDDVPPSAAKPDPEEVDAYRCGLQIVSAPAPEWGHSRAADGIETLWAELGR
jgi:hypothetical protein